MEQCASAAKEVGKDNLDTGLMITSPQELNEAEGVADTNTTQFFSEEMQTTRESDTKDQHCCWFSTELRTLAVQQTMILARLLHRIASCSVGR